MKLPRMAPNSVFAILLRSPWWISIGLALLFLPASRALLPAEHWTLGAMAGVPFLVIGLVALARQLRAPSAARVEALTQAIAALSWRDFADALERAWVREGWQVTRLQGAADFALARGGRTTLVSARRWKAAALGVEPLQALHQAMQAQDAHEGLYLTLGHPSDNAARFAAQQRITLLQSAALVQLLRDLPVRAG